MTWREATKLGTANLMALAQEHDLTDEILAIKQQTRYWYFKACSLVRNTINAISSQVEVVDSTPFDGETATLAKPERHYDLAGIQDALDSSDLTNREKKATVVGLALKATKSTDWNDDNLTETLKFAYNNYRRQS